MKIFKELFTYRKHGDLQVHRRNILIFKDLEILAGCVTSSMPKALSTSQVLLKTGIPPHYRNSDGLRNIWLKIQYVKHISNLQILN